MATAINLFHFILQHTMGHFRRDLYAKETALSGIVEEDLFQEGYFSRIEGANFFVVAGKIQHFVKTDQVDVAMTDESPHPLQALDGGL